MAMEFVEVLKYDINNIDGLDGVTSVIISPDGKFLYAAASDDDAISVFERNDSTGKLTFVEVIKDDINNVDGLNSVNNVATSPDGKFLYSSAFDQDAISVFERDDSTAELTLVQVIKEAPIEIILRDTSIDENNNLGGNISITTNNISVNVNEAPTELNLSNTSIDENVPAGSIIGDFTTIDPDSNDTFTYTLVDGEGDNSTFEIVGNQLKINVSPDFETKSSYSIKVKTTDSASNAIEKTFTINVSDVKENPDVSTPNPTVDTPLPSITTVSKGVFDMEVIDFTGLEGETVMATYEISREADYDNNIYFYTVDSKDGNIDGIIPDQTGYLQQALANVVSDGLTTADGTEGETGTLNFTGGDILGIAIVADGTLEQAISNIDSVEGVYLSYMGAGASTDDGSFDHIRFDSTNSTFEFEDLANGGDGDFNDIKIKMEF